MVLTIHGLEADEQYGLVEPDEVMEDDGLAGKFARGFVYDDTPYMEVVHEVFDLMCLADPLVGQLTSVEECYEDIPDDGLDAIWSMDEQTETVTLVVSEVLALPVPEVTPALCAYVPVLLGMPETSEIEIEDEGLMSEVVELPVPEVVPVIDTSEEIVEEAPMYEVPTVVFSFGPMNRDSGRTVCMSF